MPPEPASEGHSLDSHHLQHKENVAAILQEIGVPSHKCLLAGSGSIAQQVREQYLNRRPGDLDFFINDPIIWELLKKIGTEVPGPIGNSVIQIKINGWDIEFFQFLPGMPDRRVKNVFKNAQWKNGVLCMGLTDITIWKWHLSRMKNRAQYKKENDRKDMKRAISKMIKDLFIGQLDYQSRLIEQGQMLLN